MADTSFDWAGTCKAVHDTGACEAAVAGDIEGNVGGGFPANADGSYKFWIYGDPYKATVTKEDGTEAEEDVYEAYNLSLFLKGQKSQIPEGVGVRLNNEKFMVLNTLKAPTYVAKIKDADGNETPYNVTIDEVHLMRKGQITVFIGVKGGYFCAVFADAKVPAQTGPAASAALAIGFYYLVGPDA